MGGRTPAKYSLCSARINRHTATSVQVGKNWQFPDSLPIFATPPMRKIPKIAPARRVGDLVLNTACRAANTASTPLPEQRDLLGQFDGVEFTGDGDETALAQAAKPGHLPLGKLTGVTLDQLDGFLQTVTAFEMLDHLAVADGLPGGSAQRIS